MLTPIPATWTRHSTPRHCQPSTDDLHHDDRVLELVRIVRRARPNVLLIGGDADLAVVWQSLRPWLRAPIARWAPQTPTPVAPFGTVIVTDVARLTVDEQARVGAMRLVAPNVHIVSMTDRPLYPLVTRGAFREDLYYQLNVLTLDLGAADGRTARVEPETR